MDYTKEKKQAMKAVYYTPHPDGISNVGHAEYKGFTLMTNIDGEWTFINRIGMLRTHRSLLKAMLDIDKHNQ